MRKKTNKNEWSKYVALGGMFVAIGASMSSFSNGGHSWLSLGFYVVAIIFSTLGLVKSVEQRRKEKNETDGN